MSADLAKTNKERYAEMVQGLFTGMTKLDVSIAENHLGLHTLMHDA